MSSSVRPRHAFHSPSLSTAIASNHWLLPTKWVFMILDHDQIFFFSSADHRVLVAQIFVCASAMAAASLCSITHGYGVNNLQEYTPARQCINRQFCTRTYFNKASIKQLHSVTEYQTLLLKCRAQSTGAETYGDDNSGNISKETLVWRAIKLPMYTVALIPITVGSAAAYWQTGLYHGKRYLMLLVSSVLVVSWLNLSNDVYDFDTGADENKEESVVKLVGSRAGTLVFAWLLLALGFAGLSSVAIEAGSRRSIFLLSCSIICGYIYQCPPFRLSYMGLGEPLCFAAFGPFATTAFYLLQTGTREMRISGAVVAPSILVGLTTALILFCSHFHQIDDDKAVGKSSPMVRLGTEAGARVVKVTVWALYAALFILGLGQNLPFSSVFLCALTLPVGKSVVSFVEDNHRDKEKIFMAKYYCVRLHTLFGAALAAGLVAARLFARKQLPHAVLL